MLTGWGKLAAAALALAGFAGRAEAAMTVKTPHATVSIVAAHSPVAPGESSLIGFHFVLKKGWHIYWQNPGDSGEAPKVKWHTSGGAQAGGFLWPAPERIPVGTLANYGYSDEITLPAQLKLGKLKPGSTLKISAELSWLVCEELCVPEKGSFQLDLPVAAVSRRTPEGKELFDSQARVPRPLPGWDAAVAPGSDKEIFVRVRFPKETNLSGLTFQYFPLQGGRIEAGEMPIARLFQEKGEAWIRFLRAPSAPAKDYSLPGVAVIGEGEKALVVEPRWTGITKEKPPAEPAKSSEQPFDLKLLFGALVAAFFGGLLLNLMPCVFPVLAIKALHLARAAIPAEAKKEGWAYTAGVVVSFLILGGLLLLIKQGGEAVGWGFQLQSPLFVLGLYFLFFVMALNFFGVFEWGSFLANKAGRVSLGDGTGGAFGGGVLAVLVATPCTAPFMGSAMGFALLAPWYVSLLIFLALGLGMAVPFLCFAHFPALSRLMPKPGAWMETLKQLLGFFLLATCVWLGWVLGQQLDVHALAHALLASVFLGAALWLRARTVNSASSKIGLVFALLFFLSALAALVPALKRPAAESAHSLSGEYGGLPTETYSATRAADVAQNHPVYLDFTAVWCLTCQVNKRVVFGSAAVREEFRKRGVTIQKGDWTKEDPAITAALRSYGRAGVPLNVFLGPEGHAEILPAVLTPQIVLEALAKVPTK